MRWVWAAAWLLASPLAGQSVVTEVVGEDAFTMQRLAKLCQAKLPIREGEWMRFTLFGSEPSPFFLQQSPVETFSSWLKGWRSAVRVRWRVAEMMAIGGDAVLRIRTGRSMTRIVLSGKDPSLVEIAGRRFEILHISGASHTNVYARGPAPLPCTELHRSLRSKLSAPFTLKVRTDPWFVRDTGFPPFYWFQPLDPPSREVIEAAPQAVCGN